MRERPSRVCAGMRERPSRVCAGAETAGRLVRTSLRGVSSATRQRAFSPTDSGTLRRRLSFGPASTFGAA